MSEFAVKREKRWPRFMVYTAIGLGVLLVLLAFFINNNLVALAEWAVPGAAPWTHLVLWAVELLAVFWFWRSVFWRSHNLLLVREADPEGQRRFAHELARRMRDNPFIREAGIVTPANCFVRAALENEGDEPLSTEERTYLEQCLTVLNTKADEETRRCAKRIFLATALTQNGRIDALIVFVSLCRLVWRVSAIYNQRPHPREIGTLYWAVVSSVFLAFSIEELDIATEITVGFGEVFHATAPAGATASIPFAGKALQTFTTATVDGAANCYLALRAGIITRNAYAYALHPQDRPSRSAVFKEAGAMLMAMSQELVGRVASAVAENVADLARQAGGKTVQAGKGIVQGVGNGAGKLADGVVSVTASAGRGVGKVASGTVEVVQETGRTVGRGAEKLVSGTVGAVKTVGTGVASGVEKIADGTVGAVKTVGHELAGGVEKIASGTRAAAHGVEKAASSTLHAARDVGHGLVDGAEKVASGTVQAVESVGNGVRKISSQAANVAQGAGKGVAEAGEAAGKAVAGGVKTLGNILSMPLRPFRRKKKTADDDTIEEK